MQKALGIYGNAQHTAHDTQHEAVAVRPTSILLHSATVQVSLHGSHAVRQGISIRRKCMYG